MILFVVIRERELPPRFAAPRTFEFEFGSRWKQLYDVEKARRAQLEAELLENRKRLDAEMETAYQEYHAQMLRQGVCTW